MTRISRPLRRRWVSGTDQVLSGGRFILLAADLDVPAPSVVRDALNTILTAGPHTRIGLQPTGSRLWIYRPSMSVPVHELPIDVAHAGIDTVLQYIRRRPGTRHSLEVHVSDRHIAVDIDHGLGDGGLATGLIATILALARGDASKWLNETDIRLPLLKATLRTFGTKPSLLRDVVAVFGTLKEDGQRPSGGALPPVADLPGLNWSPSFSVESVTIGADRQSEVDSWRKANIPSCGTSFTWLFIARRALRAAGFRIADDVMVAFNCRRYLPDGERVIDNFAAGLEIAVTDESSMDAMGARVRRITSSALPLAALGMVSTVAQFRPRGTRDKCPEQRWAGESAVRLMYSDLGRIVAFDDAPWRSDDDPSFSGLLDPATPESITLFSSVVHGVRTVSASFHDNVVDRNKVADAMRRIREEPLRLLNET